jgi:hypothetical protein
MVAAPPEIRGFGDHDVTQFALHADVVLNCSRGIERRVD